jgi:hypothetical protein
MMTKSLKKGDDVSWQSRGGIAHGKVVSKQTSATSIKDLKVKATTDDPQFIVETDKGKRAAHKPAALTKE